MINSKLISVIIPNYNGEKTLPACLSSLLNQDEGILEVIIVDDGSKDNSKDIIEQYIDKNEKIKAIYKKNGGASSARNEGIKAACGKYILFLDSDDTLEEHSIDKMLDLIEKNDVLVFSFSDYYPEKNLLIPRNQIEGTVNGEELRKNLFYYTSRSHFYSPCNKLYKAELIKKNEIFFPEGITTGEDYLFNLRVASVAESMKFINLHLYRYFNNPGSVSHTVNRDKWENHALMIQETYKLNPERTTFETEFNTKRLYSVFSYYSKIGSAKETIGYIKKYWKEAYENCDLQGIIGRLPFKIPVKLAENRHYYLLYIYLSFSQQVVRLKQKLKRIRK